MLREVTSVVILTQLLELWLQKSLHKQQRKYSIIISKASQDFKKAHASLLIKILSVKVQVKPLIHSLLLPLFVMNDVAFETNFKKETHLLC